MTIFIINTIKYHSLILELYNNYYRDNNSNIYYFDKIKHKY